MSYFIHLITLSSGFFYSVALSTSILFTPYKSALTHLLDTLLITLIFGILFSLMMYQLIPTHDPPKSSLLPSNFLFLDTFITFYPLFLTAFLLLMPHYAPHTHIGVSLFISTCYTCYTLSPWAKSDKN